MASVPRVLLVDSDPLLRASLAEQLSGLYDIIAAGSIAEARAALAAPCACAIIDPHLAGGEEFARELLAGMSVLLLGADAASAPGLERIAKPFRFSTLLARLQALAGRHGANESTPLHIGPYLFRPAAKLLTEGDTRKIRLTEKETNILKFLHQAAGTVPRQTLLHEVWGYNPAVTTHTLETHIYRLRRKIEENPGEAKILVTEEGGYRLA